jgi:cell division protein FtsZ
VVVRFTVIATGFEHDGVVRGVSRPRERRERRDREVSMDDMQRSSLEIREDEIDIPSFLKDR